MYEEVTFTRIFLSKLPVEVDENKNCCCCMSAFWSAYQFHSAQIMFKVNSCMVVGRGGGGVGGGGAQKGGGG